MTNHQKNPIHQNSAQHHLSTAIWQRLSAIQLLVLDVDGVLTNGKLYYDANGEALKVFNTLDGHGIKLLARAGIATAIITGRSSLALTKRMQDLGVMHVYQGVAHKKEVFDQLLMQLQLKYSQVAYVGDDLPDYPILSLDALGLAICPKNAHPSIRSIVDWCLEQNGGEGAVRAVCDALLTQSDVDLFQT